MYFWPQTSPSTLFALSDEPLLSSGNEGFNSALKDTSLEENTVPAFKALNSNVSTKPDYLPLIAAAGVFLLETNHVTQLYLHSYSSYLKADVSYYVSLDR